MTDEVPQELLDIDTIAADAVAAVGDVHGVLYEDWRVTKEAGSGVARVQMSTVVDALNEMLRRVLRLNVVAKELLYFRQNTSVPLPTPPSERCGNCIFFMAAITAEAGVAPQAQLAVLDTGICRLGPPVAIARGAGDHQHVRSFFPPVHPHQRCGAWQCGEPEGESS